VAEAGVERADGETLAIVVFLGDGLDRGPLHDQHGEAPY
jgi:hypothetical protein